MVSFRQVTLISLPFIILTRFAKTINGRNHSRHHCNADHHVCLNYSRLSDIWSIVVGIHYLLELERILYIDCQTRCCFVHWHISAFGKFCPFRFNLDEHHIPILVRHNNSGHILTGWVGKELANWPIYKSTNPLVSLPQTSRCRQTEFIRLRVVSIFST